MGEDWDELKELFDEATQLDVEEREAFARRRCADNPELLDRLLRLLGAHETGTRFEQIVGEAAADAVGTSDDSAADTWTGRQIGPWEIRERIASGGMGAVFLAERTDGQFEQQVAIKVMSSQLLVSDAVTRFRAERQILANLNHPYIAQLHDGGTLDDGLPYLVMEYVDGVPIDEYCDGQQLDVEQRLQLFLKVCEAVDYAHRKLTVHRDLKPSNILIRHDGSPKLLDFGIAKLLDQHAVTMTMAVTRQGTRAMTPEYASPEQVRGEPVSIATDVYSLGVLMYRMLTGESPYGPDVTSVVDYERAIVERDPRRPSTAITAEGRTHDPVQPREALYRHFSSRLAGDIDTVALKALQKEPERRYLTVRELGDDVRRHLEDRPILARPDSLAYRARKFVRRNRVATAATGLLGIALFAFLGITLMQNQRIAEERDAANRIAEFLIDTYTRARPEDSPGETVTAKQVLDSGYERIEQELSDDPRIKARLLWVMGESYVSLGLHQDGASLLKQSAELGSQGFLDDDDLVDVLANLGQEYSYLGEFDEATAAIERAQSIFDSLGDADPALATVLYKHQANNLRRMGRMQDGLPLLIRAEEAARNIDEDVDGQHPDAMHSLGSWHYLLGNLDESEYWLRRALQHPHPRFSRPTTTRAVSLGVMGSLLRQQGRIDEALQSAREALEILRQDAPGHVNVAVTLSNMAMMHLEQGDLDEADRLQRESFEILTAKLGPDHSRVGVSYGVSASIREAQDRYDEALDLLDQSLEIKLKSLPRAHPSVALTHRKKGVILRKLGKYDAALDELRTALEIVTETSGAGSSEVAQAQTELGIALYERGAVDEAEQYLQLALPVHENARAGDWLPKALHHLGAVQLARGNCDRARPHLERALLEYESLSRGIRNKAEEVAGMLDECADTRTATESERSAAAA